MSAWIVPVLSSLILGSSPAEPPSQAESLPGQSEHDPKLSIRVTADRKEVEFGRAFEVLVVRTWHRELEAAPWQATVLNPLRVESAVEEQHEAGEWIEQRLTIRCRAFEREGLRLDPIEFFARAPEGGPSLRAQSEPLKLTVLTSLPEGEPGAIEWPSDLLPDEFGRKDYRSLLLVIPLLAVVGIVLRWLRRRSTPAAASKEVVAPPHQVARERLAAMRACARSEDAPTRDFYVALSTLLRDLLAHELEQETASLSVDQLGSAVRAHFASKPELGVEMVALLERLERMGFSANRLEAAEQEQLLRATEDFIREAA